MPRRKKTKLKLNDIESLSYLMQETYNDACTQQIDANRAINEMMSAAEPQDVDDLTKLAREKANLLKIKDSAIRVKLELSKIKTDFLKYNNKTEESTTASNEGPNLNDFQKVRDMMKNRDSDNDKDIFEL